jgi:Na+/H+ antiporter NhaC
VDGVLVGIVTGVLFGLVIGVVVGITVLAYKHPKSYEKLFAALLIILLGALAGGTFWDLSKGAGYSRFIVMGAIIYFSFLRILPLLSAKVKSLEEKDDR